MFVLTFENFTLCAPAAYMLFTFVVLFA